MKPIEPASVVAGGMVAIAAMTAMTDVLIAAPYEKHVVSRGYMRQKLQPPRNGKKPLMV